MTEVHDVTPEVRLRQVEDRDLDAFFEHQADQQAVEMAAFPARDRHQFAAHWAKVRADDANVLRTIVADGQVAGNIGSWQQDGQQLLGYWVGRDFWGRGVATRALALLVDEVSVRPLYAHVVAHNVGSIRVLEKGGFRRDRGQEAKAQTSDDGIEELIFVLHARADEAAVSEPAVPGARHPCRIRRPRLGGPGPRAAPRAAGRARARVLASGCRRLGPAPRLHRAPRVRRRGEGVSHRHRRPRRSPTARGGSSTTCSSRLRVGERRRSHAVERTRRRGPRCPGAAGVPTSKATGQRSRGPVIAESWWLLELSAPQAARPAFALTWPGPKPSRLPPRRSTTRLGPSCSCPP